MISEINHVVNRSNSLFHEDLASKQNEINNLVLNSSFLVIGGAGSIGQAVVKELFQRGPKLLHVIDINENNLAELVRDLRSSFGYISGEFNCYAIDVGSHEFTALLLEKGYYYDYVFNLSALKHVRSEKDPYTLMRMIQTNIINTSKTVRQFSQIGVKKYFCVSTDKAASPVNMMGASKKIMELFLLRESSKIDIAAARFANVAFSDGSLLHGFTQRVLKRQPIAVPSDIQRYFITPEESGQLCLMSCIFGSSRDIFIPKPGRDLELQSIADIAQRFIRSRGYEPYLCGEEEGRSDIESIIRHNKWPCVLTQSDTTGEKPYEEFFTSVETVDFDQYRSIAVVKNNDILDSKLDSSLENFQKEINALIMKRKWTKRDIVDLFFSVIPDFQYEEKNRYLDSKM